MLRVDINCDLGEGFPTDEVIMPYISSANIACTYHAGDEETIRKTVLLSKQYKVNIGAHPSFLDRENFGRAEIQCSPNEVFHLITHQLQIMENIVIECDAVLHHVKPHGALYNMAAKDPQLAKAISVAVKEFSNTLKLYGLSGSCVVTEAKHLSLQAVNEAFADRSYQDDGSLTHRSFPNALITDVNKVVEQVLQMVEHGTVTTVTGKQIPIIAETICIHGDGTHAVQFAQRLNKELRN